MWKISRNIPDAEVETKSTLAGAVEYARKLFNDGAYEVVISSEFHKETFVMRKLWD